MSMKFTDEYKSQFADDDFGCPSETDIAKADPSWKAIFHQARNLLSQLDWEALVPLTADQEEAYLEWAEQIATDHIIHGKPITTDARSATKIV